MTLIKGQLAQRQRDFVFVSNTPLPRVTLVLGGARSGKSRYAEGIAEKFPLPRIYVATAEGYDEEMRERIALHRARRDVTWTTIEAPRELAEVLTGTEWRGVVLVDCLTLWLSNIMLAGRDVDDETARLVDAIGAAPGALVLVSNEVGLGIVPDNALSRRFRDAQGRLNQQIASVADHVVLLTAGLPLVLK